jgi:exodeoxyribonuclease V alpha subunit
MTLDARLETLRERGVIADIDLHFARFMCRIAGAPSDELELAACLASHRIGMGHACADLAGLAGRIVLPGIDDDADAVEPITAPPLEPWIEALRAAPVVGVPGDDRPLVLDAAGRLYLHRYWSYERTLAADLLARAGAATPAVDLVQLGADLDALFPREPGERTVDWQRVAAVTAVLRRLCVISGGPGTGKTTTAIRILALLARQSREPLRVALAAPTGKAAARLQEAMRAAAERLPDSPEVRAVVPDEARTIHRLLGARPRRVRFRHDREHLLAYDVVVVDEASMVDLALMAKLVAAVPPAARLVLLGDRDQLASVEAGAVLGDLCGDAPGFSDGFRATIEAATGSAIPRGQPSASALCDSIVLLTRSHRFAATSGIGRLAAAVNRGDGATACAVLGDARAAEVGWRPAPSPETVATLAADRYAPYLEAIERGASPAEAFTAFRSFRLLAAHRRGPWGVEALNALVADELARRLAVDADGAWYAGRPVLVTENDYTLGLFNGDVGIALPDPAADGDLRVTFEGDGGQVRRLSPMRLPAHEPVWAMTVHKSQGSEFDRVLLVLPDEDSLLLTRELVYTAVTRARERVEIAGDETILLAAIERRLVRSSGLRDALWAHDGALG